MMCISQALGKLANDKVLLFPGRWGATGYKCNSGVCEKVEKACKRKILAFPGLAIQRAQKQVPPFSRLSPENFRLFLWY